MDVSFRYEEINERTSLYRKSHGSREHVVYFYHDNTNKIMSEL